MSIEALTIGLPAPKPLRLGEAALFLDLDGTLAEFEPTPSAVAPDPARTELLRRLRSALDGRMAVISGRTLDEIDRIVERVAACAAGVHGLERRDIGGGVSRADVHPELPAVEQAFRAFAAEHPGVLVESKRLSTALHWRQAPEHGAAALAAAQAEAERYGLKLQRGDRVAEVRTPGADKGSAVAAFMAEAPFEGAVPIFLGDDVTDEDAFALVEARGGIGVLVGPDRDSAASARLSGVSEVLQWLERSLRAGVFEFESRGVA